MATHEAGGAVGKLNVSKRRELDQILDRSVVGRSQFDATFDFDDGTLLKVLFRDRPEFCFEIREGGRNGTPFSTSECPGRNFVSPEEQDHRDFSSAFSSVHAWCDRLVLELMEGQRKQRKAQSVLEFFARIADQVADPETPLSAEEAAQWEQRLKNLEERFREMEEKSEIQAGHLTRLVQQLAELQKHSQEMPKRTWIKAVGDKVAQYLDVAATQAIETVVDTGIKAAIAVTAVGALANQISG